MKAQSIRVRLTIWYFLSLAVILGVFALGCQFALKESINHAVDEEIGSQIDGVARFLLREAPTLGTDAIKDELSELSSGGGFLRVLDGNGRTVYQSDFDTRKKIPVPTSKSCGGTIYRSSSGMYRIGSRWVTSGNTRYSITVARSLREFSRSVNRFQLILLALSSLALVAACVGGFWLSRRALAPVDAITETARKLTFNNLSTRLQVPKTNDELQRLTETLNTMLDRIERPLRQMHQFTADASHELRAPLTLIRTAAEFSLRRERSKEELVDSLSKILSESERTSTLVDNLLLLSRADSGIDDLTLAPVNFADPVRDAIQEGQALARDKHVAIEWCLGESPIFVSGHYDLLRRAVFILIDNAVKYTPEGGAIRVALEKSNSTATLTVKDTGLGITADQLPHIFDRFWRADKVRSRSQGGVGLGLAIAQTIIARHDGSIDVASKPGAGSAFSISLPLSGQAADSSTALGDLNRG